MSLDSSSLLSQALGMAQMLSFTSGNPAVIGGVVVVTTAGQLLLQAFSPAQDPNTLVKAITDHIDAWGEQLLDAMKLQEYKELRMTMNAALVNYNSRYTAVSTAANGVISPSLAKLLRDDWQDISGPNSSFVTMILTAKQTADASHNYFTLPLSMAATLAYLSTCQFYSTSIRSYLWQQWLTPPVQTDGQAPDNALALAIDKDIYTKLGEQINFAYPLVKALNASVLARAAAADKAAASVQVFQDATGYYRLNPTIAANGSNPDRSALDNIGISLAGAAEDPNSAGTISQGYGFLSQRSAQNVAILRRGQLRRAAWVQGTADGRLTLMAINDVYQLNYALWTMNTALQQYTQSLGADTCSQIWAQYNWTFPPALTDIYPPPTPFELRNADSGVYAALLQGADTSGPVRLFKETYVEPISLNPEDTSLHP